MRSTKPAMPSAADESSSNARASSSSFRMSMLLPPRWWARLDATGVAFTDAVRYMVVIRVTTGSSTDCACADMRPIFSSKVEAASCDALVTLGFTDACTAVGGGGDALLFDSAELGGAGALDASELPTPPLPRVRGKINMSASSSSSSSTTAGATASSPPLFNDADSGASRCSSLRSRSSGASALTTAASFASSRVCCDIELRTARSARCSSDASASRFSLASRCAERRFHADHTAVHSSTAARTGSVHRMWQSTAA